MVVEIDVCVPDREAAIVRLSKWCAAVYRSIDEFHVDKDVMAQLAALPMIPLVDGEVVRLQDSAVFFPFNAEEKYKQIEDIGWSGLSFQHCMVNMSMCREYD